MSKQKKKRELLPPWEMPSDPIKAVVWFMQWLLKVLVRFCWIPILLMTTYEIYLNWPGGAIISGVVTLLVGIGIWSVLYVVALLLTVSTTISRVLSDVSRVERNINSDRTFYPFNKSVDDRNVVEGTITDLEEERKKRRRE